MGGVACCIAENGKLHRSGKSIPLCYLDIKRKSNDNIVIYNLYTFYFNGYE
jgi:hypothetical protein